MRARILPFLWLIGGGLTAPLAVADRADVPLALETRLIESTLRQQVFTGAGQSVRINDDRTGCQFLELRNPRLSTQPGRLVTRTNAWARVGRPVAGRCILALDWQGEIEFTQTPVVGPDQKSLIIRVTHWRALKPDGSTDSLSTTVGGWLDQFLPPSLKEARIDFARPVDQLKEFLALMLGNAADGAGRLNDVRIERVSVGDGTVGVTLGVDYTPLALLAAAPESVLTPAEIEQLERRLDDVDAFFTYTVKSVARTAGMEDTTPMLDVLVELRRELIRILGEERRSQEDPARQLFLDAWEGLTPLLTAAAAGQGSDAESLRYLTFVGAGDALRALDQLGPAAGVEVSSAGLRRLARILLPEDPADPLEHQDGVDAELRASFGFGAPLPPPEYLFETSLQSRLPTTGELLDGFLDFFFPSVVAAAGFDPTVAKRLNSWVPKTADVSDYLPLVQKVLAHAVTEQLRANPLEAKYQGVYRQLVFAAAWQESCWRQFVVKADKRVPMQSSTGDIGMMQINPKVWRGFYDLQGLRWDIVYNARAGADILEHHLNRYAIAKKEDVKTGSIDNLARASYAAYNGGPRQYDRYRRADTPADAKKIDALFYEKFRAVKSRGELAVSACYGR
ncbi:MAG: transglycosylase SLT domain-containing protein [Pseudomonadales bacterium]